MSRIAPFTTAVMAYTRTNPPGSKAPDRPDFHRGLDFARRFARKGREITLGLRG